MSEIPDIAPIPGHAVGGLINQGELIYLHRGELMPSMEEFAAAFAAVVPAIERLHERLIEFAPLIASRRQQQFADTHPRHPRDPRRRGLPLERGIREWRQRWAKYE